MKRRELIQRIAEYVQSQAMPHPVRVGIDGVDAAGKTYLADELAKAIQEQKVIRASIDGFHNPREVRYQQGQLSPEGYYYDSFNNQQFAEVLLKPLGSEGDLKYRTAVYDYRTNSPVDVPEKTASPEDILIVDGIFLFRPELKDYWDIKIFVDVPFSVTVPRAIKRDADGNEEATRMHYEKRYVAGQQLYFQDAQPKEQADIVIDNTDFNNPSFTKR
jgi:uridine kinase